MIIAGSALAALTAVGSPLAHAQGATNLRVDAVSVPTEDVGEDRVLRFSVDIGVEGVGVPDPVSWRVSLSVTGSFTDVVALPTPASLDATTLGSRRVEASVTVPGNVRGRFFLAVELDPTDAVDESNPFDNRGLSTSRVRIRAGQADLRAASVQAGAARVLAGEALVVRGEVRNAGEVSAEAAIVSYLSADEVISTADVELARQTVTLAPGEARVIEIPGPVPAGTPAGDYMVGLAIDPEGLIPELLEANNVASGGTVTVRRRTVSFTPTLLPDGALEIAYLVRMVGQGGDGRYAYDVESGGLPTGLELTSAGALAGIPTETGTFTFSVRVTSDGLTDSASFTVSVAPGVLPLQIAWGETKDGFLGLPYQQTLVAGGGEPPYRWTLQNGSRVPAGMSFGQDGLLSGTPTELGQFVFGVTVEDRQGATVSADVELEVTTIRELLIGQDGLPAIPVGMDADISIPVMGGLPPYIWTALTPPPPGLTLTSDGRFVGVPTQVGTWPVRLRVTDRKLIPSEDDGVVRLVVEPRGTFEITTTSLPSGTVALAYEALIEAEGGTPPYTWRLVPGTFLPAGFSIVPAEPGSTEFPENSLRFFGRPEMPGNQPFAIRVEDTEGRRREVALLVEVAQAERAETGCRCASGSPSASISTALILLGILLLRRRW